MKTFFVVLLLAILSGFAQVAQAQEQIPCTATVQSTVNLRPAPSIRFQEIRQTSSGETFEVHTYVDKDGYRWYFVKSLRTQYQYPEYGYLREDTVLLHNCRELKSADEAFLGFSWEGPYQTDTGFHLLPMFVRLSTPAGEVYAAMHTFNLRGELDMYTLSAGDNCIIYKPYGRLGDAEWPYPEMKFEIQAQMSGVKLAFAGIAEFPDDQCREISNPQPIALNSGTGMYVSEPTVLFHHDMLNGKYYGPYNGAVYTFTETEEMVCGPDGGYINRYNKVIVLPRIYCEGPTAPSLLPAQVAPPITDQEIVQAQVRAYISHKDNTLLVFDGKGWQTLWVADVAIDLEQLPEGGLAVVTDDEARDHLYWVREFAYGILIYGEGDGNEEKAFFVPWQ